VAAKHDWHVDFFSAIDDPQYFHGRRALLDVCRQTPWRIRVLLGGRRIGKTSFLNQFQCEVAKNSGIARLFTAYMNIGLGVPSGKLDLLNRLLSRLSAEIRPPIDRSWSKPEPVQSVEEFESRLEGALKALRVHGFHGVCFAMDECETLVGQGWWTEDASQMLRFEVESARFRKQLSFIFTGFHELRDHRQNVGSRLMEVAEPNWLAPLESSEVRALVHKRCGKKRMSDQELAEIEEQAGGHPMLTQRLVSSWLDSRAKSGAPSVRDLAADLRVSLDQDLEAWWGRHGVNGGCKEPERRVYLALLSLEEASILDLAGRTSQSEYDCRRCLHALCGSGIVIASGLRSYRLGARIFADWVRDRGASSEARIGPSPIASDAPSSDLRARIESGQFDVFLCHNSKDKPEVKMVANRLRERGLLPWLDEWELRPGMPWQHSLEEQIAKIRSVAVFIGSSGIGPWQDMEQAAFLREFVNRKSPVIPVILPDAPKAPKLPLFLQGFMWVDFRRAAPDPLTQLIWGITGKTPKTSGGERP
jgi:hypothetical protein